MNSVMLRFAAVAVAAAASGAGSAEAFVRLAGHAPETPRAQAAVMKAGDGHYWAQAQVNGRPVRFLVDTGATAVALTPADAQRLGFDLARLRYGYSVMTAGGQARAAAVKLASVSVAGAKLEDVDALVIESGLDASLLGMSYLGRLSSFQATRQALILRP